ncbi:MAG: S46 family peptidase [Bacteroidetes bacterium]|nr:S46 family peptidase [Bacteroidota bacterium]
MKYKIILHSLIIQLIFLAAVSYSQQYYGIEIDTVKAQKFDMGKMWTFENPPLNYFEQEYNFKPTDDWLEKVRKSALRLGNGCSASFISADGLIMTNHHCVRGILPKLNEEDEDLLANGFFAETLDEERLVAGLFANQLIYIEDITADILSAMEKGETDSTKIKSRDEKIEELKTKASEEFPELNFKSVSYYEGSKFSLYGYRRYNDIRLVFVPELWVAKLGGDYDNFTYPRYGLDCAFLRAYDEDGNPVQADFYFSWNDKGVVEDQPVFVVGNPGSTDRIYTTAQIEYARDFRYPMRTKMFRDMYAIYEEMVIEDGAQDTKLIARLYSIGNGLKVFEGTYKALLDPYLMARKKNFENEFKNAVQSNPELNLIYGKIWKEIEKTRTEAAKNAREMFAYSTSSFYSPKYFFIASELVELAEQLNLPEDERDDLYNEENLDDTIESIFPADLDSELQKKLLFVQVNILTDNLIPDDELILKLLNGKKGQAAVDYLLSNSIILTKDEVIMLANAGADSILNSNDPFIYFVLHTKDKLKKMKEENKALSEKDELNNQLLGKAMYAVYGDAIPPDATFTLRLADGVVKGYNYNGTRAPYKTTFYGSLDRYYSNDKKFPFNLPDYWEELPEEFDLSTTFNFVSTNDIVGGNSGSPVININAEIVGLAFDGNIESLPARYIYTTEANRTVSVSAQGMIEAIRNLYKAERLSEEILRR